MNFLSITNNTEIFLSIQCLQKVIQFNSHQHLIYARIYHTKIKLKKKKKKFELYIFNLISRKFFFSIRVCQPNFHKFYTTVCIRDRIIISKSRTAQSSIIIRIRSLVKYRC